LQPPLNILVRLVHTTSHSASRRSAADVPTVSSTTRGKPCRLERADRRDRSGDCRSGLPGNSVTRAEKGAAPAAPVWRRAVSKAERAVGVYW
jgi:hypothetical protein